MLDAIWLVAGLALLIGGADLLVRGVCALARAAGVPPLIIGLTIVAFGTSLPEAVINTFSAAKGQTGLAFGNIVGSCAINIGVVLAVTALIRPLTVEATIITRELPMMLLAVAALLCLCEDRLLSHASQNVLTRGDGLVLLLLFCVFLYYMIKDALARRDDPALRHDALVEEVSHSIEEGKGLSGRMTRRRPIWNSIAMTIGGLIGVALGGRLAVLGAVGIAKALDVPEVIIGLTLVSFGTTLPELVTSITAARRGQADIAVGNIVGSNIFNILFVGGLVSTIHPIDMPDGANKDLLMMAVLSVVLLPVAVRGPNKITRTEGACLLVGYVSYVVWRALFSTW